MAQEEKTGGKKFGDVIETVREELTYLPEEERLIAIKTICELLKIPINRLLYTAVEPALQQPATTPTTLPTFQPSVPTDIKTLKKEKKPGAATEMAAIIAYYLSEIAPPTDRKNTVNKNDLEKYFKQANFQLPGSMRVVLPNAKQAGYFDFVGEGEYKLNPVGYNLVVHSLPRKTSPAPRKQARKKTLPKKPPKKSSRKKTKKK